MKIIIVMVYLCILPPSCSGSASPSPPPPPPSSLCPLNLDYVAELPWDSSSCKSADAINATSKLHTICCQTLTSLYGVGFAQHLGSTSLFRLPSLRASESCLASFQSQLGRLGLDGDGLVSSCFDDPRRFVNTTNVCAGIRTREGWVKLNLTRVLESGCRGDLSELSACDACVAAGFRVQTQLLALDGDISHSRGCFHYAILYAAGVVNELGPTSAGTLSCILGLPLIAGSEDGDDRDNIVIFGSIIGAGFAAAAVTCLIGFRLTRGGGGSGPQPDDSGAAEAERSLLEHWRPRAESLWYDAGEIERATQNFSAKNLIGRGQFGEVYKGRLGDGSIVAVKKLVATTHFHDFFSEVEIISTLKHRNLVPLKGCCVDGDGGGSGKYLVYDFMPNGNLGEHLFPKKRMGRMSWVQRKSVILDVANALLYLHRGVDPPVYHRDIKPTNILLDSSMRARVSDFGLAKRPGREGEEPSSHLTTRIVGTHGYLAPEYGLYGQLTEKSDVYSFGVVILEIMCGRKALDLSPSSSSMFLITDWAWALVKAGKMEQALDPYLLRGGLRNGERRLMKKFVIVGILCAHLMVALRPTILDALKMLEGDVELPTIPDRPLYA